VCDQDSANDGREPTGVEHLAPPGTQGQLSGEGVRQIAVEVCPSIGGPLVPQPPIELDSRAQSENRRPGSLLPRQ
jgi:hypothetical protein